MSRRDDTPEPAFSGSIFDALAVGGAPCESAVSSENTNGEGGFASGDFNGLCNHLWAETYYRRWTWLVSDPFWKMSVPSGRDASVAAALTDVAATVRVDGNAIDAVARSAGVVVRWGLLDASFRAWMPFLERGRAIDLAGLETLSVDGMRAFQNVRLTQRALTQPGRVRTRRGWRDGHCVWIGFGPQSSRGLALDRIWFHPLLLLGGELIPVHSDEERSEVRRLIAESPQYSCFLKPPSARVFNRTMDRIFRAHRLRWENTRFYPDLIALREDRVKLFEIPGLEEDDYDVSLEEKDDYWSFLQRKFEFIDYDPVALSGDNSA